MYPFILAEILIFRQGKFMENIKIGTFTIGKGQPLTLISGPCVIESKEHTLECAERLVSITKGRNINLIFKASYDKANRSSYNSFRGPGMTEGLAILQEVKERYGIPVLSDIHLPEEVEPASKVLDILQIPAFLCRQTDLVVEAAKTGKPLHLKKGQFMAPWDMKTILEKARSAGNSQVVLCDRGASFGYNNLVSDMRSLAVMATFGVPVSYDASHSVQLPGGLGNASGGQREFIPTLARSAVAAGIQVLFLETHPNPPKALSDSASVFPLNELSSLLDTLLAIHDITRRLE
jgi:2-dehydro-3-deoxyphosphooctonate aldolase (KDO 8-P synthase)